MPQIDLFLFFFENSNFDFTARANDYFKYTFL